jgi:hypothetical protein
VEDVVGEEEGLVVSAVVDVPGDVLGRPVDVVFEEEGGTVVVLDEPGAVVVDVCPGGLEVDLVVGGGAVLVGSVLLLVPPPGGEVVVTGGGLVVVDSGGGGVVVVGAVVVPLSARLANWTMEAAREASTRRTASTAETSDSHTPSLKRSGKYLCSNSCREFGDAAWSSDVNDTPSSAFAPTLSRTTSPFG